MNVSRTWVSVCVVVGLLAGTAQAVNIDLVTVGNPGNAPDTRYNSIAVGGVAYTYQMGKFEVTAGQYCEFLNAVAKTDTYGLYNTNMDTAINAYGCNIKRSGTSGSYTYSLADDWANRPVNWVSYWDACRFTNWLHNNQPTGPQGAGTTETGAYTLNGYNGSYGRTIQRNAGAKWAVTSEDEWYKAAYYKGGSTNAGYWDYPTSSNTPPGQDMSDASGNNANYYTAPYTYPLASPYYTTVVGQFQNSASPYGTFDQGGNVWEWNEAVFYGSFRGLRGGSFDLDNYGGLLASDRNDGDPTMELYLIGFRVAEVPEPATAGLLLLGGLLVARRRRALR